MQCKSSNKRGRSCLFESCLMHLFAQGGIELEKVRSRVTRKHSVEATPLGCQKGDRLADAMTTLDRHDGGPDEGTRLVAAEGITACRQLQPAEDAYPQ